MWSILYILGRAGAAPDAAPGADLDGLETVLGYRVDTPNFPGAVLSSDQGSLLAAPPPAGTPYTEERLAVPDAFTAEEALIALDATPWHAAGIRGQGVKIAVFDSQWYQAEALADELGDFSTQDCGEHRSCDPEMDTLRPRYSYQQGSHGVACAETIRDIAPDAELYLVRVDGPTTLENAAAWAVRNDIDIVSMSMSFFNNSFHDGTGRVNDDMTRLAEAGVLMVNSAGNYAREHWSGAWYDPDNDGVMDFPWGSEYLPVYGSGGGSVVVSWDEFTACGRTDFDVFVYDQAGVLRGQGTAEQARGADRCAPVESVGYTGEEGWSYVQIVRQAGVANTQIAVFARGGAVYQPTPGGLADPASDADTFTVGAVRADRYLSRGAESFSSTGPSHSGVDKPDISGPDGLSTATYGPIGFYGTSAATPATAAAIALVMSAYPSLTPREAAERLAANAIGDRTTFDAWDGALGAGRARLWSLDTHALCGARSGAEGAAILFPALLWWKRGRSRCC